MRYLLLVLILISCSKKKVELVKQNDLWQKLDTAAHHEGQSLSLYFNPKRIITCGNYAPDCVSVVGAKLDLVTFSLVEFKSPEAAAKEAKRLNQYSYVNWVIDDTRGEPYLEKFFHHAIELK